jgi:hypothetical protein
MICHLRDASDTGVFKHRRAVGDETSQLGLGYTMGMGGFAD